MKTFDGASIFQELDSEQLPVLPPAVSTLLTAFEDESLDYLQIATILENFPTIVLRLISLANSAWSAPIREITALDAACARLGLGVVKSISIALAISAPFDPSRCPPFDGQRYWVRAMAVAETAFSLAMTGGENCLSKSARTAGVLHNLGLLWMAHQLPDATGKALLAHQADNDVSVDQTVTEIAGAGYRAAGGYLARLWCLPDPLAQVMEFQGDNEYMGDAWQMARLVGVAVSIVAAGELEEPWTAPPGIVESLEINPADAEHIYEDIGSQLKRIQESAVALTGH